METHALLALFAAAAVNSVIPGPGMFLAGGRAAARGFAAGAGVTLGMLLATALVMAAVWAVMAGLLRLSEDGLAMARWAGIAVLTGLALAVLCAAPPALPGLPAGGAAETGQGPLGDVAGGLATGLASPVHLLFLCALVPQFLDVAQLRLADMALVTAGIVAVTAPPMLFVSAAAARTRRLGAAVPVWVGRASGVALLGFAGLAAFAPI